MKMTRSPLIRPTVRGLVLALAVTALSSFVARAVPYASQVTKSGSVVTFVLNEAAAGITVLTNGVPLTPPPDVTTAGSKSFDMLTAASYSIIVTGNTTRAWTKYSTDVAQGPLNLENPKGVAINKNPASTNFGKVYVSNARVGTTGTGKACTDGIYVLRADGAAAGGPYTGGVDWTTDGTRGTAPWKSTIGPDDHLYVTSYYQDLAYEFSADMGTAAALIDDANKSLGQYVGSIWVDGTKAAGNRQVYLVDYAYLGATRGLIRYDLGSADTAIGLGTGTQVIGPDYYAYYPWDVARDSAGYFYLNQYRATAGQAPCVSKFDVTGTLPVNTAVWAAPSSYTYTSGLDVDSASGRVALGRDTGGNQVYIFNKDTGAFVESFNVGASSDRSREVAFDAAGNLITIDNISEYVRYWSPGGQSIATTSSDGTFSVLTPAELSVVATDPAAAELGPDPAIFTITRSRGPNADLQVYFTLAGTAVSNVDYTISPTSPFTMPAGQTTMDITVTPINDSAPEAAETVVLTLASGDYLIVNPSAATAIITDDDLVLRYWDANGAAAGASGNGSGTAPGTWGTDAYWSTSESGEAATAVWTDWASAVFSAGSDAWGTFTVTVNGTQKVDFLDFQEGIVTLDGGTLTLTNRSGTKVADRALIKSVISGAGLTLDGPGSLVLAGANTYTGPTTINAGNLVVGAAAGVIPNGSAVSIGGTGTLNLMDELFSATPYDETIGSLAGAAGAVVNVPGTKTLTFGGDNTNTVWDGTTTGDGSLAKVGTGTINIGGGVMANTLAISGGTVQISAPGNLGSGNAITIDNGATLESTSSGVGSSFYTGRAVTIAAGGGTLRVADGGAILMVTDAISGPGTLTTAGPGELRTYNVEHSFAKLIVKEGLYTGGHGASLGYNTSFGAIPTTATPDAITIYGGAAIRKAGGQNVALDAKQGITLAGTGTKTIRSYAGDVNTGTFELTGTISGTGPLELPGPSDSAYGGLMVLKGQNTYSGGTIVRPGGVYVINSFSGSGTGSGTVGVTNATLGGEGSMGGLVLVEGGNLTPGYSYYTGGTPGTPVTKEVAKLVLTNGLDISRSSTNTWQLGALSTSNPGTDWDQVELTGGNLTLGGSSVLAIGFTGTATAPDLAEPFWQQSRQWQVIKFGGGGSISGNFSTITGTNGITAGRFITTVDATGVNLVYTLPSAAAAVTNMTIGPGPGAGQLTISHSGGSGNQFVLFRSFDVEKKPISTWDRVATNAISPGSFTITIGSDPKAFYYIKAE